MSARSRAAPWFGTLGERLEAAETEARAEEAERTTAALRRFWLGEGLPGYQGLGEISALVKGWHERPGFREVAMRAMGLT